MAKRVRLIKERVRLEKEPEQKPARVRLAPEEKVPVRVKLVSSSSSRVRLEKPVKQKYFYSEKFPHLHTRIVAEKATPGEEVRWIKHRQDDGSVLYERLVVTTDVRTSRMLLNATSPYGLADAYKKFQGIHSAWIPGYLKSVATRQARSG